MDLVLRLPVRVGGQHDHRRVLDGDLGPGSGSTMPDDTAMAELSRGSSRGTWTVIRCGAARTSRGRSPWETFPTVTQRPVVAGNVVLLGDCAHTSHFSIGSGTTMALADAAALGRVIASRAPDELPAALQRYQDRRLPVGARCSATPSGAPGGSRTSSAASASTPLGLGFSLRTRKTAPADEGQEFRGSPLEYGLHRATQWRVGRAARRTFAATRRAARDQRPADPARRMIR